MKFVVLEFYDCPLLYKIEDEEDFYIGMLLNDRHKDFYIIAQVKKERMFLFEQNKIDLLDLFTVDRDLPWYTSDLNSDEDKDSWFLKEGEIPKVFLPSKGLFLNQKSD